MKTTLSILALSAAIGLGAVHAYAADPAPAPVAGQPGPGGHPGFFKDADTNKDGVLTKDEMEAASKKRVDDMFDKADTNKDGKLSKDELKAYHEQMRAKMRDRFQQWKEKKQGGAQ